MFMKGYIKRNKTHLKFYFNLLVLEKLMISLLKAKKIVFSPILFGPGSPSPDMDIINIVMSSTRNKLFTQMFMPFWEK